MDKLQMAHEMALAIQGTKLLHDMELVSEMAWKYADAMQAEAEKRKDKTRPEALCQVDWSVAPEEANVYFKDGDNEPPEWFDRNNKLIGTAPDFGFSGYVCEYRPQ